MEHTVIHNTFVLERTYPTTAERVFEAFSDPAKKKRWYAEGSERHDAEEFMMDFRVGGSECTRYRFKEGTPFPGLAFINDGTYLDIVTNQRVVMASAMVIGDRRISASLVTVELLPAGSGTNLVLTHQGAFFKGSDGPQMREEGWRKLLERMAQTIVG